MKASATMVLTMAVGMTLVSPMAAATVSDEAFQLLKDQIAILNQRLADVEKERAADKVAAAEKAKAEAQVAAQPKPATANPASWADKVKLNGDFRYRYEAVNVQGAPNDDRNRLRARFGVTAAVTDTVGVGIALSTGNDDPISGNQTLDNAFSRKTIGLDQAYFDWAPVKGAHIEGGKFKTPFYRPGEFEMIWDSDLRPEGLAATYDNGQLFGSAAVLFARSFALANEVTIYGLQGGGRVNLGDNFKLTGGVSFYDANDVKNRVLLYNPLLSFGNTTSADGKTYLYGYKELEGFAEAATRLFDLPFKLFADYVDNTAVSKGDTGWATGLSVGEVKNKGTWVLTYAYMDLEPDAVLGVWTDSDFGGGGTNKRGHVFAGSYALTDRTNVRATYFLNQRAVSSSLIDYSRLQMDLNFRF